MRETIRELAFALRSLRRRPLFAATAVATLALALAAFGAIFAVVDQVLLSPLPFHEPGRVVTLWESSTVEGVAKGEVAAGNFLSWAEGSSSFEALGLAEPWGFDARMDGRPVSLRSWAVSEGFFAALGVEPLHGRLPGAEHYLPGAPRTVLLSEGFWRRRFGADPSAVGGTIELDGEPSTILGILPGSADYPEDRSLWAPRSFTARDVEDRTAGYRYAIGRLLDGVPLTRAQRDLDTVSARLAVEHPQTNRGRGVVLVPLVEQILGPIRPALLLLLTAACVLLAVASANVGNLCLERYLGARSELAVRVAIGAGRGRLVRQLLLESTALAGLAAVAGTFLAGWSLQLLVAAAPARIPRLAGVTLDARALGFLLLATVAASLVVAAPALVRLPLDTALSPPRSASPGGTGMLRGFLVSLQVGLSLLLLVGSGLLSRSLVRLLDNDLGFDPGGRVFLQAFLWDRNPSAEERLQTAEAMRRALEAVPGVRRSAIVTSLPFAPDQHDAQATLLVPGRAFRAGEEPSVYTTVASDGYFETLGIRLLEGRTFSPGDRLGSASVAVVSATLARRLFPAGDAVGSRVTVGVMGPREEREIVGVVADVRPLTFDSDPRAELYVPYAQSGFGSVDFVVEGPAEAGPLVPSLERAIWSVDPGQSLYEVGLVEDLVAETVAGRRLQIALLGAFSALALLLAAVGLYGVVAFHVASRSRDIGVRMALGAEPSRLVGDTIVRGLAMAAPGVLGGVVLALATTRLVRHLLYGVSPTDPVVLARSAGAVLALCSMAALVPALRAARIDPVRTLRQE